MPRLGIFEKLAPALLSALMFSASSARAAVTISTAATQNMSCQGGVCMPTAVDAVLNINDVETFLAQGSLKVTTTGSGVQAKDIVVDSAFSWSSASGLTLDASHSIVVEAKVVAEGTPSLTIATGGGALSFERKGHIEFRHVASGLVINGTAYRLVNTIRRLAALIAANPSGAYALARSYDASRDATYGNAPIVTTFSGGLEGLGNAITNLAIDGGSQTGVVGLFEYVDTDGTVQDLRLVDVNVVSGSVYVGALAGDGEGAFRDDSVSGTITGNMTFSVGGLIGSMSGTVNNCRSSASVTNNTGNEDGVVFNGGLLGTNFGTVDKSDASGTVTGNGQPSSPGGLVGWNVGTIRNSHATGAVTSTGADGSTGGLVGFNQGPIERSYATGTITGDGGSGDNAAVGGLVGYNAAAVTNSWATGNVSDPGALAYVGGLVGQDDLNASVKRSWASGAVSGTDSASIGGLVGENQAGDTVSTSFATGTASGGQGSNIGGLVGENEGTIVQSFSSGATTSDRESKVGGFVGVDYGSVANSYATGNVNGGLASYAGGLIGFFQPGTGATLSDSYSTGTPSGGNFDGGLVGFDNSSGGAIADCYWDTDTSGIADLSDGAGNISNDPGITGLTTAQFQSGLPTGFRAKIWNEESGINGGLPYLLKIPPP